MSTNEYNQCVDMHSDALYRYALSMLKDIMKAEDIVQVVFERFWLKKKEVDFARAKAYLMTSVYRACIDQIRSEKAQYRLKDRVSDSVSPYQRDQYELKQMLEVALGTLKPQHRSIIMLRDYEGYSYKDIAKIMDITEAQVKINIFRTRKKLQSVILSMSNITKENHYATQ